MENFPEDCGYSPAYCLLSFMVSHDVPGVRNRLQAVNEEGDDTSGVGSKRRKLAEVKRNGQKLNKPL